ncbi:hypothetical protein F4818DRAFT_405086 [Hypoxylon cercidicola]|nr:hypothetical protein F4818DRAFT_405086 [Hypoxylon cercidicola]
MARTKAKGTAATTPTSAAVSSARRPFNALFLFIFLAFTAAFIWLMRVDTALNDVPVDFLSAVESGRFGNGTPLESRYTGIKPIDDAAKFLVAAFLSGTAGWDAGARMQQAYFLMNWFAVVCVWIIEASRRRNAGKLLSFVTLHSLIYQFVGAGIVAPLYCALYVLTSTGDAYHYQGREVPIGYARALLPSALLGYLAPTVALYYIPWDDIKMVQYMTAFWQPFPLLVCVPLLVFSVFMSSTPSAANVKDGDVKHLKRVYLVTGLVATVAHVYTIYTCVTSSDPQLSLSYVFLPNKHIWKDNMAVGLHYVFQWDFWGAYGASLVWCWVVVYDVLRLLIDKPSTVQLFQMVLGIGFVTLVAGPGTAIVTVWNWREDRLVMIENGVKGTWKKPKAA